MIDEYTRLLEATAQLDDKKAADEAVSKLIAHLKSSGRMKMLPQIARELRKVAARRLAQESKVEVAHEKDKHHALIEAGKMGIDARHATVNHTLIDGWRARKGGALVDRSAKRALIDIYQKVTG